MSTGARARVRIELTNEIKAAARRQLAEVGAAALSLRAVAREVGMVSSAVYRYFPSRDDLLTALIIDAYDAVGEAAEVADRARSRDDVATRWLVVARGVRAWALANPQEYALVYGSPVPGYLAPEATIDPASRVPAVLLGIVRDGVASGEIVTDGSSIPRSVRRDLRAIRDWIDGAIPDDVVARGLFAWTELFGAITFELFGHLHDVIHDFDTYFDIQMHRAAEYVVTGAPVSRR